jgi:uncharacterized membrane protein YidH (DUF202 family)
MSVPDDLEDVDPGLARERTELAWHRTAISFAALGGALLKIRPVAGIPVLVISAAVWQLGRSARMRGTGNVRGRRLLLISVAITAISVAALIISFLVQSTGIR